MPGSSEEASALAQDCARQIVDAFARYNAEFRAITRRAPLRFDARDWRGSQQDAIERIGLYDRFVNQTIAELRLRLEARALDRSLWMQIQGAFALRITELADPEFTKTFFSSISRRLFGTVGVAPDIEFVATDLDPLASLQSAVGTNTYVNHGSLSLLFEDLLGDVRFRSPWRDLDNSIERVAEAVVFLKAIMPRKPVSELFTVLGRAKQGKTERYRELMRHLEHTRDLFAHAPGERGLVMVCFTLPSFDVVFKVIRDRFPYPKSVLREEVMAKYQLVFKHDRAGRLVDAQEFRRLRFPTARFAPELLDELRREATTTVHEQGGNLIFDHMYIERRMTPLNLYLRTVDGPTAERVVLDYGQCIRDLAYTNIFAGDLLLKNFGVTRHGRVIFYDYDELCQVTDCNFRDLPQPTNPEDEMRGEPWFYVGENDVFPETFIHFLAFSDSQRAALLRVHGEVLTAAFWRGVQQRLSEGEVLEVLPYHPHRVRVASSA